MSVLCLIVGHHRARRHVVYDGHNFRAPCVRCGVPMIREFDGKWRVSRGAADIADPPSDADSRP